ncbi:MAG: hypothetical protein GXO88_05710 [Chlorobi bacterium]|nr:hypothetical protein [Chlorobiota bacterium]
MTLTLIVISLLFHGFQSFPVSLGSDLKSSPAQSLQVVFILVAMQIFMLWLGLFLGDKFLYLAGDYGNIILFIGFLLIGLRISIETFAIRKGERTFNLDDSKSILLASTAQSINSLLVGILLSLFIIDHFIYFGFLAIATLSFSALGTWLKLSKSSLAFASFIYLIGGIFLIAISFYFGFFSDKL